MTTQPIYCTGADGTMLAYRDYGPRDGETIVLCHGLCASGMQFEADAQYFAAKGWRVLVPDVRGHGNSASPVGYPAAGFAIAVLAADMVTLLDHAQVGPVHWVGNSLGGIVALQMLAASAERFASLTTFGTAYRLNLPALAGPVIPALYGLFGARLLAQVSAFNTTRSKSARALIVQMMVQFDPQAGRAIANHVRRYDLTANALAFSGPMLVLVGGRDTAVNLALRPALRAIGPRPNWHVVDLPEGGHCANLDATAAFRAALLAFWG